MDTDVVSIVADNLGIDLNDYSDAFKSDFKTMVETARKLDLALFKEEVDRAIVVSPVTGCKCVFGPLIGVSEIPPVDDVESHY